MKNSSEIRANWTCTRGLRLLFFEEKNVQSEISPVEVEVSAGTPGVRTHTHHPQHHRAAVLVGISWCLSVVGGGNDLAHLCM